MSVFYIVGKPRGGKSFLAVKAICDELRNRSSSRFIVTNIRLFFDDREVERKIVPSRWQVFLWHLWGRFRGHRRPVAHYVKETRIGLLSWCAKYAPHVTNVRQRIRVLEDDETGEFWLYEPGWTFENRKKIKLNRRGTEIEVPDFTYSDGSLRGDEKNGNPGTLYVIDEVHIFFPARAWQRTGEDATFFLSQHGKLKADCILVTQHPEQCDKALRRLAQEYMTVRNLSREPVLGFRLGNWFRFNRMLQPPSSPNPFIFDSGFIHQDWETYGSLYDTSQGVGVAGSLVPNVERRGRSLWWLLPIPVIICWVIYDFGPLATHFQHFMSARMLGMVSRTQAAVANQLGVAPPHPSDLSQEFTAMVPHEKHDYDLPKAVQPFTPTNYAQILSEPDDTNLLQVVGYCLHGRRVDYVFLSNGRELSIDLIRKISKDWVYLVDGSRFRIAIPPVQPAVDSVPISRPDQAVSETANVTENSSPALPMVNNDNTPRMFPSVSVYVMHDSRQFNPPPISGMAQQFGGKSPSDSSGLAAPVVQTQPNE